MRNRLIMGAFRYGRIQDHAFAKYDLIKEVKKRIDKFTDSNNLEHLVDAANMCLLAFVNGQREGKKMEAIDDGEHAVVSSMD